MRIRWLLCIAAAVLFVLFLSGAILTFLDREGLTENAQDAKIGQFDVLTRAFLSLKMYAGEKRAWMYLQDENRLRQTEIAVYNSKGQRVPWPGQIANSEKNISGLLDARQDVSSALDGDELTHRVVLRSDGQCGICHRGIKSGAPIGVWIQDA